MTDSSNKAPTEIIARALDNIEKRFLKHQALIDQALSKSKRPEAK